jgi:galactose oxidase
LAIFLQIFVLGGSWSGGLDTKKDGEKLIPGGTWTRLPGILASQILTDDKQGIFRADNHAWLFAWSNGEGAFPVML